MMIARKKVRRKKKRPVFRFPTKALFTSMIILGIAFLVRLDYLQRKELSPLKNFDPVRSKGNADAPFRLTAYIDYMTEDCAIGYHLIQNYMEKYPNKLYLQIRFFPMDQNHNALIASIYASCSAQQSKFWEYHDLLLKRQTQWSSLPDPHPVLKFIATSIDLNDSLLEECVQNSDVKKKVLIEKSFGEGLFVKSAPTYFLDEKNLGGTYYLQRELDSFFNNPLMAY